MDQFRTPRFTINWPILEALDPASAVVGQFMAARYVAKCWGRARVGLVRVSVRGRVRGWHHDTKRRPRVVID